ncbi:hypothetical protein DL93DRAFT_2085797 [Clavulina sp. PMI_390]|nr:hypothetical protein DL93DRAFT_2085797 [Clavulina sp. PMI_390]
MSFAQQKSRQYSQLSQTIQSISNELNISRDLLGVTSRHLHAMGKFGALHAAQMMAVETVETHIEEHGQVPYSEQSRPNASDENDPRDNTIEDPHSR